MTSSQVSHLFARITRAINLSTFFLSLTSTTLLQLPPLCAFFKFKFKLVQYACARERARTRVCASGFLGAVIKFLGNSMSFQYEYNMSTHVLALVLARDFLYSYKYILYSSARASRRLLSFQVKLPLETWFSTARTKRTQEEGGEASGGFRLPPPSSSSRHKSFIRNNISNKRRGRG